MFPQKLLNLGFFDLTIHLTGNYVRVVFGFDVLVYSFIRNLCYCFHGGITLSTCKRNFSPLILASPVIFQFSWFTIHFSELFHFLRTSCVTGVNSSGSSTDRFRNTAIFPPDVSLLGNFQVFKNKLNDTQLYHQTVCWNLDMVLILLQPVKLPTVLKMWARFPIHAWAVTT